MGTARLTSTILPSILCSWDKMSSRTDPKPDSRYKRRRAPKHLLYYVILVMKTFAQPFGQKRNNMSRYNTTSVQLCCDNERWNTRCTQNSKQCSSVGNYCCSTLLAAPAPSTGCTGTNQAAGCYTLFAKSPLECTSVCPSAPSCDTL